MRICLFPLDFRHFSAFDFIFLVMIKHYIFMYELASYISILSCTFVCFYTVLMHTFLRALSFLYDALSYISKIFYVFVCYSTLCVHTFFNISSILYAIFLCIVTTILRPVISLSIMLSLITIFRIIVILSIIF